MNKQLRMFTDEDYRKKQCAKKLVEVDKRLKDAWEILGKMSPVERINYTKNN